MNRNLTSPPQPGKLDVQTRLLIALWASWSCGNPAQSARYTQRLGERVDRQTSMRLRKAILSRNWGEEFDPATQAMLSYVENLALRPQQPSMELRRRLLSKGYSDATVMEIEELVDRILAECRTASARRQSYKRKRPSRYRRRTRAFRSAYRPMMRTMHNRFNGI